MSITLAINKAHKEFKERCSKERISVKSDKYQLEAYLNLNEDFEEQKKTIVNIGEFVGRKYKIKSEYNGPNMVDSGIQVMYLNFLESL